ncbi:MAG: S8 family serine peptidase, partial [Planctomycetota bacterium]
MIALLDTGVDGAHPDLLRALLPPIDLIGKGVARAIDLHGHGTAQAGVLISSIDGHGVVGIAPGARVLPVRVAHRSGEATQADLARGLIAAADRGANIILIPMGAKAGSEALHEAVRYATNRGSLIIASVGNEVTNHALYPAAYEEVLAVGASDFEGQLAYTTVLGPAVDVYAPGEDLPTTHRRAMHGYTSGTSAAASYTAGVAALLMSAHPAADAVSVAQAIRASARPIEALGGLESMLPAGTLDPAAALARLGSVQLDLSVAALEVAPARPLPGSEVVVRVKVRNDGGLPVSGATLAIRRLQAEVAVELTRLAVPSLAPGRETTIEARVALGEGLAPAQIEAQLVSTDDDARRDRAVVTVTPTQRSVADVAFTGVTAIDVDAEGGALTASFVLTNRGNQRVGCGLTATDTHGVAHVELGNVISAGIADEASEEQAAPIEGKRGRRMGNAPLTLAPGERREVRVRVRRRLGAPLNVASLRVTATTVGLRDSDLASNQCGLDWSLPDLSSRSVKPQYQQAGDMDWVVDAPWRITAGRTYVPLLVFLPEKGDPDPATYVEVERMRMLVRDPAQAPGEGVVIYEDTKSAAPSIAPSGLVMLDEEARQIPGTDIFEDQQIQHPGHYRVLRVPTGALGVTAPVFQDVDKDLEVQIDWSNNRFVFLFIRGTRTGTHRKSLRVGFASRELASIGE